jgi:hypothetical protein
MGGRADLSQLSPPIRLDDSVYFWPDRRTMEHLRCHAFRRRLGISAEAQASADPVYGPMS